MASAGGQRHHILKPVLHTLKRISIFTLSLTTLQAAAFDNSVSLRLEFSESLLKLLPVVSLPIYAWQRLSYAFRMRGGPYLKAVLNDVKCLGKRPNVN